MDFSYFSASTKTMLRTCLLLILCIALQRTAVSQELSEEQWEKLIPILKTDDSTELAQSWADFSESEKEVLMVVALTNKPKLFAWTWRQIPGADFSDLDVLLKLALSGGFTEVPKLAHERGWNVQPEVWAGVVTANYETYQFILILLGQPELLEMMPAERPDEAFVEAARWLVSIGIPYDYVLPEDRERLTPATWKVIAYLLEHQPPQDGQGDIANWKLAAAVQFGTAGEVRKLLEEGEGDPSFVEGNRSLLWYGVRRNDPLIAKYLLQYGADPMWQDSEGETSALAEAVFIGNADMVRELLPYIPSVNYKHKYGNTVLHYLADFSHHDIHDVSNKCSVTADTAGVFTRGHLAIIRMLKDAGADFNAANECGLIPLGRLHRTIDSNWVLIAQVFADNTTNQSLLMGLAEMFDSLSNRNEEILFRTIISRLTRVDALLYSYAPREDEDPSPNRDNMLRQVVQYAVAAPRANSFALPLLNYAKSGSLDMVRWILHDVPRKYEALIPGINTDSLKAIMVNQQFDHCENTIVQELLSMGSQDIDPVYVKIMREIMLCRPNLYLRNKCNYRTALDQLIASTDLQKLYGHSLQPLLLQQSLLDINPSNATVVVPETGDRLRRDLYAFRQDKNFLRRSTYCFEAMLRGDGLITSGENIRVNVAGYGMQNTGNWPKKGCDSIDVAHIMNNTPANFAYVYYFDANRSVHRDRYFDFFPDEWPRRYDQGDFSFGGASGLEKITLNGTARVVIPPCVFDDKNHNSLPLIRMRNQNGLPLTVEQGPNQFKLEPSQDTMLDRSLGEIVLTYGANNHTISFSLYLTGNVNYTAFEDLSVPQGNNDDNRVRLYLEIARLQGYLKKPELLNVERKNIVTTIHLLSEYAMQRDYLSRIREDYRRVNENLGTLEEALTNLNNFYRNFATLTWENLPMLVKQLELAIASPKTPEAEKKQYRSWLEQLLKAQSLLDLARVYNELFNSKFNQLIDQYVSEYQRLTLELSQYRVEGAANIDRQLLFSSPASFRKALNLQNAKKSTPKRSTR